MDQSVPLDLARDSLEMLYPLDSNSNTISSVCAIIFSFASAPQPFSSMAFMYFLISSGDLYKIFKSHSVSLLEKNVA
jgi:hypothetical protein